MSNIKLSDLKQDEEVIINAMELTCHKMNNGEVLNSKHTEYPLFNAILYGDRVLTAKFSKRLSCSIKHLPLRVKFNFEYDIQKALDAGVITAPTLSVNGKIFLEGLVQAEDITQKFQELLNKLT